MAKLHIISLSPTQAFLNGQSPLFPVKSMKKILITGALGFIGFHLSAMLIKKKMKVVGLDNLSGNYSKQYYLNNLNILKTKPNFFFRKINLLNKKHVDNLLRKEKFDFVVHCAAKTNVRKSIETPLQYLKTNVLGTQILLEAIKKHSPKSKTILLSSSSVYGKQKELPLKEKNPPNPISPYGLSKYLMEQIANFYSNFFGLKIIIIRPSSVYGPRGRQDMAPFLLIKAAEKGIPFIKYGNSNNNSRDWLYIDDLTNGLLKIIENNSFPLFEIFNFGSESSIDIDEFILTTKNLIKEYLNKKLKIIKKLKKNFEMNNNYLSIEKAKKKLKHKPKIRFKEGFKKLLEDYIKNNSHY
jgi:UDP-glucuronate 4-epimerase